MLRQVVDCHELSASASVDGADGRHGDSRRRTALTATACLDIGDGSPTQRRLCTDHDRSPATAITSDTAHRTASARSVGTAGCRRARRISSGSPLKSTAGTFGRTGCDDWIHPMHVVVAGELGLDRRRSHRGTRVRGGRFRHRSDRQVVTHRRGRRSPARPRTAGCDSQSTPGAPTAGDDVKASAVARPASAPR